MNGDSFSLKLAVLMALLVSQGAAVTVAQFMLESDFLVYRPTQAADAYNDHFQVIWDDVLLLRPAGRL